VNAFTAHFLTTTFPCCRHRSSLPIREFALWSWLQILASKTEPASLRTRLQKLGCHHGGDGSCIAFTTFVITLYETVFEPDPPRFSLFAYPDLSSSKSETFLFDAPDPAQKISFIVCHQCQPMFPLYNGNHEIHRWDVDAAETHNKVFWPSGLRR
jgi:hypothetical protein